MGTVGFEPTRLAAPDPKSGPSASSGTSPEMEKIIPQLSTFILVFHHVVSHSQEILRAKFWLPESL